MDSLFERRELTRNVHINSKFLRKNIQASLIQQLRINFEGHCSGEGYIQPNSITIINYSIGRSNYVKGGVDYLVSFQGDICLPHRGQVFRATVSMKSKIGIHAESPPMKVLIPRDLHIGNAEFESVEDGQEIEFEVVGSQFKQRDRDIIVVGRLKSAIQSAPILPLISRDVEDEVAPVITSGTDEKLVTIVQSEVPKKTRKLKKPSVEISNGPNEA
jgi:DNA-directed RNA polymerase subunit E'/Rpb7